jgi:hypothetical protein
MLVQQEIHKIASILSLRPGWGENRLAPVLQLIISTLEAAGQVAKVSLPSRSQPVGRRVYPL